MPDHMTDKPDRGRIAAALSSKPGLGALFLLGLAGLTFQQGAGLRMGSAASMGPGYFPMILVGFFILFAIILGVEAWRHPDERIAAGPLRPLVLMFAGVVLFSVLLKPAGGAVAIGALVAVTALAETDRTLKEIALLVLVVVALIWVIFGIALNLQLHMLPEALG